MSNCLSASNLTRCLAPSCLQLPAHGRRAGGVRCGCLCAPAIVYGTWETPANLQQMHKLYVSGGSVCRRFSGSRCSAGMPWGCGFVSPLALVGWGLGAGGLTEPGA